MRPDNVMVLTRDQQEQIKRNAAIIALEARVAWLETEVERLYQLVELQSTTLTRMTEAIGLLKDRG